jgi:hypothetical protein
MDPVDPDPQHCKKVCHRIRTHTDPTHLDDDGALLGAVLVELEPGGVLRGGEQVEYLLVVELQVGHAYRELRVLLHAQLVKQLSQSPEYKKMLNNIRGKNGYLLTAKYKKVGFKFHQCRCGSGSADPYL